MLTEPQAFSVAVQALLSAQKQSIAAQSAAGGEHLAFFGSGREIEDQYVHMVVAFFLQRHVQFVGLVQGGFQAVHQSLANSSIEDGAISKPREPVGLVDHNAFLCLVCREENVAQNQTPRSAGQTTPVKSDFFERIRSKSAVVKDKLIEYIVNPNISPENQNHSAKSTKSKQINGFISRFRFANVLLLYFYRCQCLVCRKRQNTGKTLSQLGTCFLNRR